MLGDDDKHLSCLAITVSPQGMNLDKKVTLVVETK